MNRSRTNQPLKWYKSLNSYYNRPEWELYDLKHDPEELNNIVNKATGKPIFKQLYQKLLEWQKATDDPWICAPGGVLEPLNGNKSDLACMSTDFQSFKNSNNHIFS